MEGSLAADCMTSEHWKRVEYLFESASGMPVRERRKFLERECRGDAELLSELNGLLSHDIIQSDTIEYLVGQVARFIADTVTAIEGTLIGNYRVVRMIGEGGMGTVYEAVREGAPSEPHVALKLVRPGTMSDCVRQRFMNERRILGILDNPSITRLLGGGEWLQRKDEPPVPYIVMELVDGENIREYCDRYNLSVRARLKLFLKVLGAVSFAHQKMVVHRDLKPSNILIAKDGTPHLLDFGIARLIGDERSKEHAQGKSNPIPVMTPAYASPEQLHDGPVNALDDIYSLGLVLFELLTGERARDTSSGSLAEVYRLACDQPVPLPSEAASDRPWLRGGIDTIVSTSLKKDSAQRYDSVEVFAQDIRLHLDGCPLRTLKPRSSYRFDLQDRQSMNRNAAGNSADRPDIVRLPGFQKSMR